MFTVESFPYMEVVKALCIPHCYSWSQFIDSPRIINLHLPIVTSFDLERLSVILGDIYYSLSPDHVNGIGLLLSFHLKS